MSDFCPIPCPTKIDCPDTSGPLAGYSSELPDPDCPVPPPVPGCPNLVGLTAGVVLRVDTSPVFVNNPMSYLLCPGGIDSHSTDAPLNSDGTYASDGIFYIGGGSVASKYSQEDADAIALQLLNERVAAWYAAGNSPLCVLCPSNIRSVSQLTWTKTTQLGVGLYDHIDLAEDMHATGTDVRASVTMYGGVGLHDSCFVTGRDNPDLSASYARVTWTASFCNQGAPYDINVHVDWDGKLANLIPGQAGGSGGCYLYTRMNASASLGIQRPYHQLNQDNLDDSLADPVCEHCLPTPVNESFDLALTVPTGQSQLIITIGLNNANLNLATVKVTPLTAP